VKFGHRADLWSQVGLGLHFTSVAFNVYVSSLLGFLLQLEVLPEAWDSVEAAALRRMVPGPAKWILPEDLHVLRRHHGMPHDFANMHEVSLAARFRVAHMEAAASGVLAVPAAVRRLDALFAGTTFLGRGGRWRSWFMHSHYHNLAAAMQTYRQQGITIASVEADLGAAAPRQVARGQTKRLAHGVQKAARAAWARSLRSYPEICLRRKLGRWSMPLFPRLRATRAATVLGRLRSLVPPRVFAAVLQTWFNGWCTKRRFQSYGKCVFGCSIGEDSVDHCMSCSRLQRHGGRRFRLIIPPLFRDRGVCFMLLETLHKLPDDVLVRRALLLAAAYRLHCRVRRLTAFGDEELLQWALDQAVKEAAFGHAGVLRALDGVWATIAAVGV
jgi:hypothetical protein